MPCTHCSAVPSDSSYKFSIQFCVIFSLYLDFVLYSIHWVVVTRICILHNYNCPFVYIANYHSKFFAFTQSSIICSMHCVVQCSVHTAHPPSMIEPIKRCTIAPLHFLQHRFQCLLRCFAQYSQCSTKCTVLHTALCVRPLN